MLNTAAVLCCWVSPADFSALLKGSSVVFFFCGRRKRFINKVNFLTKFSQKIIFLYANTYLQYILFTCEKNCSRTRRYQ